MAKLDLKKQISSTSYNQNNFEDDFDGFITSKPIQKQADGIVMLPLNQLIEYEDEALRRLTGQPQPFKPYDIEALESLSKSIAEYGVIDPITVRPIGHNKYQILAGRNRTRASALCGKKEIPSIVRNDIDDIGAAMIMLDTNLEQRHNLNYSEKAFAYKMRIDLQNRQGKRTDLQKDGQKIDTLCDAGKKNKDSRRTVAYLIRLTFLIKELLALVDEGEIGFKVGVEISYLSKETQQYLFSNIVPADIKLKLSAIKELRRLEEVCPLNPETIQGVFRVKPKAIPASVTISGKKLQEYSDIISDSTDIEALFLEFLKQYKNSIRT